MDIMLRNGQELNIKWTISISLIFHIFILFFLLSFSLFTRTSPTSFNSMYKPFTAVQVNLVDMPAAGLTNTVDKNIEVSSPQPVLIREKQEVKSQKSEVRSQKSASVKLQEDAVVKSGTIPQLENKKQASESISSTAQTGLNTSKGPSGSPVSPASNEAKLTTPWPVTTTGITGGIAGTRTAGPAVDAPDFKYDYYLGLIRNKVDNRWNQPVTYSQVKKVVVEFTILRNGRIDHVRVSESSGDTYFDQTAVRAVSVSAPFPPLPKGYKENFLRVRYKFIFEKTGKG